MRGAGRDRTMLRVLKLACSMAMAIVMAMATSVATAAQQTVRTEKHSFRVQVLTRGLDHPWSLAFLPDGRMLISERPGRLRIVAADGTLQAEPVKGLARDRLGRPGRPARHCPAS